MIKFWRLTVTGSTTSSALLLSSILANYCGAMLDIADSSQVVCFSDQTSRIFRFSIYSAREESPGPTPVAPGHRAIFQIASIDAYYLVKFTTSIPILASSNFATIKNPTWTDTCYNHLVDNIDDRLFMMSCDLPAPMHLKHYRLDTWKVLADTAHADLVLDIAVYGGPTIF